MTTNAHRSSRGVRLLAIMLVLTALACSRERAPGTTGTAAGPPVGKPPAAPARWGFGHAAPAALVAQWNTDVMPDGRGLPAGGGTAAGGAAIYAQKCALCHGANGEGVGPYPRLIQPATADSFPFDRDFRIQKTIGNYWPYATTVYEYINRAMPYSAPGSLTPSETYALTAFLLARNRVIPDTLVIDARSLPRVRMPGRGHFVPDDRKGGPQFR